MKALSDSFHKFSKNIALIDGDSGLFVNYADLQKKIESISSILKTKKSLIFSFCRNTVESVTAYLAALQQEHAICLIDAKMHHELKETLVMRYRPHFILEPDDENHDWQGYKFYNQEHLKLAIWKTRSTYNSPSLHPDLQLLLSTSGTTGSPKLIRLTSKNIESNAVAIDNYLEINESERAIASLPFHYSYGLSVLNSHLIAGASIVLTRNSIVQKEFWKIFNLYRCSSFAGVPYTYQILDRLKFEHFSVPSLHTMTQAGGKLSDDLILKFSNLMKNRNGRFFVMYGQTEATARISYLQPDSLPDKIDSIGSAIPGGNLKIYDTENEVLDPYKPGELVYEGPNVMLGYASVAEDFAKGDEQKSILRTGDIGYMDEDGLFYITGRLKRFSKIYGLRINLDEIEEKLRTHGQVAITGTDNKIYVCYETDADPQIHDSIRELVTAYQLHPSTFELRQVSRIPLTSSGKIDYNSLQNILYASR